MSKLPNYSKTGPGGIINAKSLSSHSKTTSMKKWIEKNKNEFGVQIIELEKIIERQVLATGNSDSFTSDMLVALKTGRRITPKMEAAINKIVKANSPEELYKRDEWTSKVVPKLMMAAGHISATNWTDGYKAETHRFFNSLKEQAKSRKTLSKKQMETASRIYVRIKKNIEKNEKKS